ncbi:LysR family transcriptional regulator [Paenibacillus sp. MBLB4367]|uniref:LysR family transcriptional regulator n=1 Tax=Paenibacillus sp. MBLB4367 TaxID=3384767 RepID=UPI0039081C8E
MELDYYRSFREVARRQSMTRAAESLGYAQSSVTTQIQKLEKHYGVPLFERCGRTLRLTPPGEILLKLASQMLESYEISLETVGNQASGTLLIGTIDSLAAYYLPPYLQQLRRLCPELNVQLQPEREDVLIKKVKEGDADVGLLLERGPADSALRCLPVREEPLVIVVPTDHPLAQLDRIEPADLEGTELIVSEESCVYRGYFERALKERQVPYRIGFELGSLEAIKQCVINGLGVGLLPQIAAAEEAKNGRLKALPLVHPDLRVDIQLLIHPKKWMNRPLQLLLTLLTGSDHSISIARGSTKP